MKKTYFIPSILLTLVFFSCPPSNPGFELRLVNANPDEGRLTATVRGVSEEITEEAIRVFNTPVYVHLEAESLMDSPRHVFHFFQSAPILYADQITVTEEVFEFSVSDTHRDFTAYFSWEENWDPIVLWDESILYQHRLGAHWKLKRWTSSHQNHTLLSMEDLDNAKLSFFEGQTFGFLQKGSRSLAIFDESFTLSRPIQDGSHEILITENGLTLIVGDLIEELELVLIHPDGRVHSSIRLPQSSAKLHSSGDGQKAFLVASNYLNKEALYTIDLSPGELDLDQRLQDITDLVDGDISSYRAQEASIDNQYFVLSSNFGVRTPQILITDGSVAHTLTHFQEEGPMGGSISFYDTSFHWIGPQTLVFKDYNAGWQQITISETGLTVEDYMGPFPVDTSHSSLIRDIYSALPPRTSAPQTGGWYVESRDNGGPSDLYRINEDQSEDQLTGL